MYWIKRLFFFLVITCISIATYAQETPVAKTDFMNGSGKIYVVMAVVVLIVVGLFIYLYALDRKITKLEKEDK